MDKPAPEPDRATGLPPGVEVGPFGRRVTAFLIDALVPAAALVVLLLAPRASGAAPTVLTVLAVLAVAAWAAWLCVLSATRAASRVDCFGATARARSLPERVRSSAVRDPGLELAIRSM